MQQVFCRRRLMSKRWTIHRQRQCCVSTLAQAKELLGLSSASNPSAAQVRQAYLEAAKQCHPDTAVATATTNHSFHSVTLAYEMLQQQQEPAADLGITVDEEIEFRQACKDSLSLTAETIEESKRNPLFRQWLQGKTDGAVAWRLFLAQHGGLAPKLRPKLQLVRGSAGRPRSETRRRRR